MTEQQKRKNTGWIIALIVLIGVGFALALTLFGGGNTPEGPEVIPPPPPAPGVPSGVALEAVNLRTGPDTAYPSYGVVPKGTSGEIIGISENRGWWAVKLSTSVSSTGMAWVAGQYVQASNTDGVPTLPTPPRPPIIEVPLPPVDGPTAVALDVVNIRSGPGVQYPAYGVAAKGAKGEVVGVSEDRKWWVVKLPTNLVSTGQGWVSADWVKVTNAENVPVIPAPGQKPPVTVPPPGTDVPTGTALDYLNIRSGPGLQYDIHGVVPPGTSGEIIGKSPDSKWWAVKVPAVPSGRGWVSVDYVQAYNVENVPIFDTP